MRYNKIKGILRARQGSHIPKYQNPFGPIAVTTIDHKKEALKAMLSYKKDNLLIDLKKISSTFNTLGQGANLTKNLFNLSTNTSALTNTLNSAYDSASSALMSFAPIGTIVGGAMKIGGFIGDGLSALGVGTDLITTADLILDSNFMKLTPIGLVNSMFAEKTQNFSADTDTIEQVGSSYSDSVHDINNAVAKSNKKYGLLSSRARNKANNYINNAKTQLNTITRIANIAENLQAMSNDISNYSFNLNGGYDLRYTRAAKLGMKLLDKINFIKLRKFINNFINLDTKEIEWEPIIDDVEKFKEGGVLDAWEPIIDDIADYWEPIIDDIELYQEGGKLDLQSIYDYYKDYDLTGINLMHDNSARTEGNTIYVNSNESAIHELWHLLSLNKPNEKYKEFYDNLNDDKIVELGGNLEFVKRFENDPGHFYLPSELEARVKAAKYMSNGQNYTEEFFLNLRSTDENKWGDNMRDLLHMFNNKNLVKIFNLKKGGTIEELETPEIEETNQKNLIPEGALHKNKHHMEHTEGLTQKGIPVIDNNGELLAEIELNEIIFTLEVTKKLEELCKDGSDDAALEAGRLLVKEILYNTDDRTGLIAKCEKGGKL